MIRSLKELKLKENYFNMNYFKAEHSQLTSQDIWDNKGKWYEESKKSEEQWDQMMDDEREALVRMVRRAVERFHDTVEEWLPESLVQKGGEYLEVRFGLLLTDIDREIEQQEEATSFQLKEAQEDILNMIQEFSQEETNDVKSQKNLKQALSLLQQEYELDESKMLELQTFLTSIP